MNDLTRQPSAVAPDDDEISLVEIVNAVLRNWRIVAILPVLLSLVAGVWSLTRDHTYVASASFMPQVAEGRASTGGAAALAQQFGVTLGSDRPGHSPQFFVDLLRGRTLLRRTVEAEYEVPLDGGEFWRGTLIQYWDLEERRGRRPPWRRAVDVLRADLTASVSRETGVVRLAVSSDHPVLAEAIAERLLDLLNEINLEVRQGRAQEEGRFISGRVGEAQAQLLAAETSLQGFLRQNREFGNSPELLFEHDRLQRQVVMRQEIYTSLLRSEEQARIDAVRDIPLFAVIDQPAGTAEVQGRRTVIRSAIAFVLGLMIAVVVAFVAEFTRRSRETGDPHYRELQGLAREAWSDLRHPTRWLRRGDKRVAAGGP